MSNYYKLAQYFHDVNYSIDNVQAIQSTNATTENKLLTIHSCFIFHIMIKLCEIVLFT